MSRTRNPEKDSFNLGLLVLEFLVSSRSSKGVSQVAKAVEIPVSSAHDILALLKNLGFVTHHEETRRYEVTTQIFQLISTFSNQFGIVPLVRNTIHDATLEFACSIYLCRMWQGESYVVFAEGPLAGTASIGGHNVPYTSAAAKVLVARLPRSQWLLHAPVPEDSPVTPRTNLDPARFIRELEQASHEGIAWNIQESNESVCSVATPLDDRDELGDYAICMVFGADEFQKLNRSQMVKNLRTLRERVAARVPRL